MMECFWNGCNYLRARLSPLIDVFFVPESVAAASRSPQFLSFVFRVPANVDSLGLNFPVFEGPLQTFLASPPVLISPLFSVARVGLAQVVLAQVALAHFFLAQAGLARVVFARTFPDSVSLAPAALLLPHLALECFIERTGRDCDSYLGLGILVDQKKQSIQTDAQRMT